MQEQITSKFSIILPVRNGGSYVKLCINSILSQTVTHFNLIVLDNCSSDGTLEYVRSLQDDRIIVYPAPKPLTIEENWGRIAGVNTNEFITLIGHDDILYPGYLAEMELLISTYPLASLFQTHFSYINAKGGTIRKCRSMLEKEDVQSFLKSYLQFKIDLMGTGFMMRSADFKRLGGMPAYPNLLFADIELWIKLCNISFKVTSRAECFSFRDHQSTTTSTSNLKIQEAFKRFVYFLSSLRQQNIQFSNLLSSYGDVYLRYQCEALSHRLLLSPKNKNDGLTVKLLLQQFKQYADLLGCGDNFKPAASPIIVLARILDSNAFGRLVFLIFKKIYRLLK